MANTAVFTRYYFIECTSWIYWGKNLSEPS